MVSRISRAALSALLISGAARAADVDLTPLRSYYVVDGTRHPNIAFRDGYGLITYTPPAGWTVLGSGSKARLVPPKTVMTDVVIEITFPKEIPAIVVGGEAAWEQSALDTLPPEARSPEVVGTAVNPLRISGRDTVEVTLRYHFSSQTFCTRVLFLQRGDRLWRWQLTAHEVEFEALWRCFRTSLYSVENF